MGRRRDARGVRTGWWVVVGLAWLCGACDGGQVPGGGPGPEACRATGASCEENGECCSGSCDVYCVGLFEGDACRGHGACGGRSESDFQFCDDGICAPGCRPDGAACVRHLSCCSGDCIDGQCGARVCRQEGADCFGWPLACCPGTVCKSVGSGLEAFCSSDCEGEGEPCSGGDCCLQLECAADGVCDRECLAEGMECEPFGLLGCCSGYSCRDGKCQSASGSTGACSDDLDCEDGLVCLDHVCGCNLEGAPCGEDRECCRGTICEGGECKAPGVGERCRWRDDCMSGTCTDGTCQYAECQASGASCAAADDCCGGGCEEGSCCASQEVACEVHEDCCEGLRCYDGACGRCEDQQGTCADGTACCQQCSGTDCCVPARGGCEVQNQCCGHMWCTEGECCAPSGGGCGEDTDCCDSAETCEWTGAGQMCCTGPGLPCDEFTTDCCDGMCGADGTCCVLAGQCSSNGDCCSGTCTDGRCL